MPYYDQTLVMLRASSTGTDEQYPNPWDDVDDSVNPRFH